MIRTMVVEDEPPFLRNIRKTIENTNQEYEVVATAFNGMQAVEILKQDAIDLVFTDINMPMMDGLELSRYIYENCPHVKVVILSGYQDFNYARQAIRYKVFDYLAKPLNKEEVKRTLERLEKMIADLREKKDSQLLYSAVFEQEDISERASAPDSDSIYMIYMCAGPFPLTGFDYLSPSQEFWKKTEVSAEIEKYVAKEQFWVVDGKSSAEKFVLVSSIEPEQAQKLSELLYDTLNKENSMKVTIALSERFDSLKNVSEIFKTLQNIVRKHLVFGRASLFLTNPKSWSTISISSDVETKLSFYLQKHDFESFIDEVVNLAKRCGKEAVTQFNLQMLFDEVCHIVRKNEGNSKKDLSDLKLSISETLSRCCTLKELTSELTDIWTTYFADDAYKKIDDREELVASIDAFICEHITEPLSNQVLSDRFGLVSSYISRLFKAYKGISPSDYIQQLRIEKAKVLLEQNLDLKVKEIAFLVGYTDQFHFSRVFKNVTGLSPAQYREQTI